MASVGINFVGRFFKRVVFFVGKNAIAMPTTTSCICRYFFLLKDWSQSRVIASKFWNAYGVWIPEDLSIYTCSFNALPSKGLKIDAITLGRNLKRDFRDFVNKEVLLQLRSVS